MKVWKFRSNDYWELILYHNIYFFYQTIDNFIHTAYFRWCDIDIYQEGGLYTTSSKIPAKFLIDIHLLSKLPTKLHYP